MFSCGGFYGGTMTQSSDIILEGKHLSKSFNENQVLTDVSIACRKGRAIGLIGENGAGKTTLMNIISGGLKPTSGSIFVDGNSIVFSTPHDARAKGIAFVHQELSLMEEMTVGENILLGHEPLRKGLIDSKRLHETAASILERIGYQIDPTKMVCDIDPAQKQITEIAKAMSNDPRLIIFDEPTSSLNKTESEVLFDFIRHLKADGVSVIMISHRMEDIFTTCDEAFVLKDGEFVFSVPLSETTEDELISKMVGRDFTTAFPPKNKNIGTDCKIRLHDVCVGDRVKHVSIDIPKGCIVGIGGLEGQGQRELSRALFGITPFTSGDYYIDGKKVHITSPSQAVKHKIAFVPDDRKAEGLVLPLSVGTNIISLIHKQLCNFCVIHSDVAKKEIDKGISSLNVKVASPKQKVKSLSGGNQQKIVFSKWIKTNPEILYLHEPTRGVDVQSKLEIYKLIRGLVNEGVSVVVFTSDILELIGLSDEIYIMYEGEVSGHIKGTEATEEKVMQLSARNLNKRGEMNNPS
jgi:ABC-type sugar transport system ATPase subunit